MYLEAERALESCLQELSQHWLGPESHRGARGAGTVPELSCPRRCSAECGNAALRPAPRLWPWPRARFWHIGAADGQRFM